MPRPVASPLPQTVRPARGIFWMCTAALGSSSMNGLIRETSADIHAFEIAFFRNFFGLMALAPMLLKGGVRATLRTDRLPLHFWRGMLNAVAMLSFFYAVTITPLATVAALGFTAPLFAALLAIKDSPSISAMMRSLVRVMTPSGKITKGRSPCFRISIAALIACLSMPSR